MKQNLLDERQRLERVWASYNAGSKAFPSAFPGRSDVTREISQSWRRSSRDVSPSRRTAPVDDPQETLREWRGSLLYAAAAPLLGEIEKIAEDNDFIVGVCDASGKLLWTHAGRHMQRRADTLHFVPGGHWDERSVGTNALALALRRGTPSKVFSAEHYLEAVHDWVCYSAPIRDPKSGLALGVLDFSTTWQNHNALGLVTATALARYIEARVQGLAPEHRSPLAIKRPSSAALELTFCGPPGVVFEGRPLKLSPRRQELLALLAFYPDGLTLDELHTRLYGDQSVSLSTLKAELSGLRHLLRGQLSSRPYRLSLEVSLDALELGRALERGDIGGALGLYRGPLLPGSRSPTLGEWRVFLDSALRHAVLQRADSEPLWALVCAAPETFGCDLEVLYNLANHLKPNDPRLSLIQARIALVGV